MRRLVPHPERARHGHVLDRGPDKDRHAAGGDLADRVPVEELRRLLPIHLIQAMASSIRATLSQERGKHAQGGIQEWRPTA